MSSRFDDLIAAAERRGAQAMVDTLVECGALLEQPTPDPPGGLMRGAACLISVAPHSGLWATVASKARVSRG